MEQIYHLGTYYNRQEIKKIVDKYYKDVFSNRLDRHVSMQTLFPQDLGKKSNILDYGCGMGGISHLFFEKYDCQVDGVDISKNELEKAIIGFGDNPKISFKLLDDFEFPKDYYNLVFSSQVIEHIHNPGNYLERINYMLKDDGYLLIGLPNIVNINSILSLLFFSEKKVKRHMQNMNENYNKANHHINGWDPLHFITLVNSCGFELVEYKPTEGTPISYALNKIPIIGKYLYKIPFQTRLSYTMFFLFKKKRYIKIGNND